MSNEIHVVGPSGQPCYVAVLSPSAQWANGSTLEDFDVADYAGYVVAATEDGSTGIFVGDFPSGLPAGSYDAVLFLKAGGSPANGDRAVGVQSISWQGVAGTAGLIPVGTLTGLQMHDYIVHGGLNRDDRDTQVYEAVTDTILELDQIMTFGEREVETVSTDVISIAGDYKINLEVDHGSLISVRLKDGTSFGRRLTIVSKTLFDLMFPNPGSNSNIGYPKFFCIFGGQVLVGPVPNRQTYNYTFSYSKRLVAPITAATDAVPYSAQYREVLKDGSLWRVWGGLKNTEQEDRYSARFIAGKERIKKYERDNKRGPLCVLYNDC